MSQTPVAVRKASRKPQSVAGAAQARPLWQQGVAAGERGAWADAATAFERAAALAPDDALMWLNLADARRHLGDRPAAAAALARCLECEPAHPVARALGADLIAQDLLDGGRVGPQLAGLPAALRRDAPLLTAVARTIWTARRTVDAVSVVMAALAAAPAHVEAHELLMFCMRDLGLKAEAAECAKTVLALEPGRLAVRMHMLFDQRGACDWRELDVNTAHIVTALAALPETAAMALPVFGMLSLEVPPAVHLKAARVAARHAARQSHRLPALRPGQRRPGPLRVGLLSYDFRHHPVTQLLAETVERLDRTRCELHLYAHGPADDSPWRARLRAAEPHFVDFGDSSDSVIAHRIRNDEIDVLVELGGHTRGSRLGVLAWRPAPVQASFLGYPGTTGSDAVDYLIGDPVVTPMAGAADYAEHIAQLSGCVLPASAHRPLPPAMRRADVGLPDGAFVMCAFNQAYKILPQAFALWCEVLRAVPHAVLWLKAANDDVAVNLRREAAAHGVAPERLIFAENKIDYAQHFGRLALADVFVDNGPYNAHTTASDALWAGLPVLTVRSDTFAGRVAASLLQRAGLPQFVCDDLTAYRDRLLALAQDPAPLAAARAQLQGSRGTSPLFDGTAFAADLLALLERMHARWMHGLAADHLPAVAPPATAPRPTPAAPAEVAPAVAASPAPASMPVSAPSSPQSPTPARLVIDAPIRLHVGGKQAKAGWKVLNIQPGPAVDYVGDVGDLSAFPDACCEAIYASHVLEHVPQQRMPGTLAGLCRLLVPGGRLMVSVPDLEVLSHTILSPHASVQVKFLAMRMMFGGQVDANDYHYFGWTLQFMEQFLHKAGFSRVERVDSFGLFKDTSDHKPWGFPISLNVVATR